MSRPLYPRGKSPRYPLSMRLGGPQGLSGRLEEEKILDATGNRTLESSVVQPVASRHTDYGIPVPPTFLQYVFKIKWQQMSRADKYINFCKDRNFRHLAIVGLKKYASYHLSPVSISRSIYCTLILPRDISSTLSSLIFERHHFRMGRDAFTAV
jgi:hypothetical protein